MSKYRWTILLLGGFLMLGQFLNCAGPADEMLAATNRARTSGAGVCGGEALWPLEIDPRLTAAAEQHAGDLARHGLGRNSHIGSDGSNPITRMRRNGFTPTCGHENILWTHGPDPGIAAVVEHWTGSQSECEFLLSDEVDAMGWARAVDPERGVTWYVAVYDREAR